MSLQLKWIRAIEKYTCEWVAGLRLVDGVISWFGFTLGSEYDVGFISLKDITSTIGTVHFHPDNHTETPIPSISDGVNRVYHSY